MGYKNKHSGNPHSKGRENKNRTRTKIASQCKLRHSQTSILPLLWDRHCFLVLVVQQTALRAYKNKETVYSKTCPLLQQPLVSKHGDMMDALHQFLQILSLPNMLILHYFILLGLNGIPRILFLCGTSTIMAEDSTNVII